MTSIGDSLIRGSDITAAGDITIRAITGDVDVIAAQDESYSHLHKESASGTLDATHLSQTHRGARLNAGGDVILTTALGDIEVRASEIHSGNDITLDAQNGEVVLSVAKDRDYQHTISERSNIAWQQMADKGHDHEKIHHTILTGQGDLTITAADGVTIAYKATGNLNDDIAQLSTAPGLAWMEELKNDPNLAIHWQGISEVHKTWDEEQSGLSGPAIAVIAIAIAIATGGMGASFVGAAGTTGAAATGAAGATAAVGTATAAAATSTTMIAAAANAGFSALVSQAAIATINAKGNLGKAFKTLASSQTVRAVAAAALTAGLLDGVGASNLTNNPGDFFAADQVISNLGDQLIAAGIRSGVDTVISGAEFEESLVDNLRFAAAAVIGAQLSQEIGIEFAKNQIDPTLGISRATQLIAHAVTGCAVGAVGSGNCSTGAAGQLAGEIAALLYSDMRDVEVTAMTQNWKNQGINISRLAGALAAAAAGGNATDVNIASDAAGTAAANNALNLLVIFAAAYPTIEGDGNPLAGIEAILDGNDTISRLLREEGQTIYEFSSEHLSEATKAVLFAGESFAVGSDTLLTYVDDVTGNRVSKLWHDLPSAIQREIQMGLLAASFVVPASKITAVKGLNALDAKNVYTPENLSDFIAINRQNELLEMFAKDNPRHGVQIGNKTVFESYHHGGTKMFEGISDTDIKSYFLELTGTTKMPDARAIIVNEQPGIVYSIVTPQGKFNLRDVSSSQDRSGAKWTIDIPGKMMGKDHNLEIKFK